MRAAYAGLDGYRDIGEIERIDVGEVVEHVAQLVGRGGQLVVGCHGVGRVLRRFALCGLFGRGFFLDVVERLFGAFRVHPVLQGP